MLGRDDLAVDFMTKYEKGEVLSLFDYKQELKDKNNFKAHCNVLAYNAFFERAQNEVDMAREANLEVGDPQELCEQYIAQNESILIYFGISQIWS